MLTELLYSTIECCKESRNEHFSKLIISYQLFFFYFTFLPSFPTEPHIHMQMTHNCRQSPLEALLNNFRKYNKTHGMTMRYGNQTIMHKDTEDVPAPPDNTPLNHSIHRQDSESSTEYSEEPDPHCDLADLQEHFQQLQEWLTSLEPTANPHANAEELAQLTKNTATHYNTSTIFNPQVHGRTSEHCYAEWHRHLMCHTVTNKPHHIFTSKTSPHLMGKTPQSWRLAHWSWGGHWYSKGESSMPSWG